MKTYTSLVAVLDDVRKGAVFSTCTVRVGFHDHDVARIAAYQEYGVVQSVTPRQHHWFARQVGYGRAPKVGTQLVIPPRPFMSATYRAKSDTWIKDSAQNIDPAAIAKSVPVAAAKAGLQAVSDIRRTIAEGGNELIHFKPRAALTRIMGAQKVGKRKTDKSGTLKSPRPLVASGRMLDALGYELITEGK